jgi:hypothetical protein
MIINSGSFSDGTEAQHSRPKAEVRSRFSTGSFKLKASIYHKVAIGLSYIQLIFPVPANKNLTVVWPVQTGAGPANSSYGCKGPLTLHFGCLAASVVLPVWVELRHS